MKKIALAMEKFSRYAGGAESYAVSLATSLIENGWEVHLFGETWDGEPSGAIFHKITIPKHLPSWAKMLMFAFRHRKMVTLYQFDVVLGFGNTIYMNVYQTHGGVHRLSTKRKVYSEKSKIKRAIKRLIIILSLKQWVRAWIESAPFRLDPRPRIVAISQMIKTDMESFFRVKGTEIEVVYNGVDTSRYNRNL
ncbi:MAG: glycosyltransferase family 4 protein, partial [Syntrophales bacterium]|nr:glycosyltransferase family 4 protein [Syntrophales bacterium]